LGTAAAQTNVLHYTSHTQKYTNDQLYKHVYVVMDDDDDVMSQVLVMSHVVQHACLQYTLTLHPKRQTPPGWAPAKASCLAL